MCGRYGIYADIEEFKERFHTGPETPDIEPNYNAAPGQYLPVIISEDDHPVVANMKWGLVPVWAENENIGYKMINARAETIFEKPAWRSSVKHHRALVPARGFYEWKRLSGKKTRQPYFIRPRDQELFAFAGLYEERLDAEGNCMATFSIVTTNPNKEMSEVHNRMPVILHQVAEEVWLDPIITDRYVLADLLVPYDDGQLEIYPVSTDVNTTKNNNDHLVHPIN